MDFGDTQTHTVSALGDLKKFLNRGLRLCLEEEKVQKVRFDRVCDCSGLQPNFSDSLKPEMTQRHFEEVKVLHWGHLEFKDTQKSK